MRVIKSAGYKKLSMGETNSEAQEALKQKGYWFVKEPMFGGEEWKNEQGDIIFRVPGGQLLSLDEYREQYVQMFTPRTREDELIKQQWLSHS